VGEIEVVDIAEDDGDATIVGSGDADISCFMAVHTHPAVGDRCTARVGASCDVEEEFEEEIDEDEFDDMGGELEGIGPFEDAFMALFEPRPSDGKP
jgi:hypothetical protein